MSELTSYNSERIYWAVEQVEREAGDIDDLHLDDNLFYIKSEGDKVIEEKDKEIVELKGQVNGFKNRSNLWEYNAVEEHKKLVQADLRITNLKESHKKKVGHLLIEIEELKETLKNSRNARKYWRKEYLFEYKECCHQKYKRCLAMADFCESQCDYYNTLGNGFWLVRGDVKKRDEYRKKSSDFWWKWHKRWLELAEKFKEAE